MSVLCMLLQWGSCAKVSYVSCVSAPFKCSTTNAVPPVVYIMSAETVTASRLWGGTLPEHSLENPAESATPVSCLIKFASHLLKIHIHISCV